MKKFVVIKNSKVSSNNQDTHNQFTTQVKMSGYLKKKRNVSLLCLLLILSTETKIGRLWLERPIYMSQELEIESNSISFYCQKYFITFENSLNSL